MFTWAKLLGEIVVGSLTRKVSGAYVSALLVRTASGTFAVDPRDSGVGRRLRWTGKWGEEEVDRLRRHIHADSRVLVVGAHIGTVAIPVARMCRQVVAIEANPNTYALLTTNIKLNDLSNCHAINVAVSDRDEIIEFLLSTANSGGSKRVPKSGSLSYYYDRPRKISVRAAPLDEYLKGQEFDLVIMDIEGSEYFALKGMQRILSGAKVLTVEFLPHHLRDVSGVSVQDFLATVAPHFSKLTIPPADIPFASDQFLSRLQSMYDKGEGSEGLIFEKAGPT